jgi:serine/threonine protein kinase
MKNRTKITKKNMKMNKKGGKLLGQGSFGYVFGEPGLPCKEGDMPKKEFVSKISKKPNIQNDNGTYLRFSGEWKAANLLRNLPKIDDYLPKIDDYFIIPFDRCIVKKEYMKPPYSEDEWRSNVKINEMLGKTMLLSEKAMGTIEEFFQNNPNNMVRNISILLNIAKGIQLLQKHNLIHNDIKPSNCVIHNKTGKIIDLADVRNMEDSNDMLGMPYDFFYFTWPSIVVYTYLYDNDKNTTEINIDVLRRLYNYEDNGENFERIHELKIFISSPFEKTFDEKNFKSIDPNKQIKDYKEELIKQKTFGIINDFETNENDYKPYAHRTQVLREFFQDKDEDDDEYNNYKKKTEYNVNIYLQKYNSIVENGKVDLLKRCDIYSFGIMLLRMIYWHNWHNIKSHYNKNGELFLFKLYQVAFYCCNQTETCPDINLIVKYLELLINCANDKFETNSDMLGDINNINIDILNEIEPKLILNKQKISNANTKLKTRNTRDTRKTTPY